jgi:hypothetical protein
MSVCSVLCSALGARAWPEGDARQWGQAGRLQCSELTSLSDPGQSPPSILPFYNPRSVLPEFTLEHHGTRASAVP